MAYLFDVVSLRGKRLHFLLFGGRVVRAFGGRKPDRARMIDRLDAVAGDREGLSDDGRTLNVGASGILCILAHLDTMRSYRHDPQRAYNRLRALFSGSAFIGEMFRGTVRAMVGQPGRCEDAYWADVAHRQLGSWSVGNVAVEALVS